MRNAEQSKSENLCQVFRGFKIMSCDLLLIHYLLVIISVFWGSKGMGTLLVVYLV